MLLRNYDNIVAVRLLGKSVDDTTKGFVDGSLALKTVAGSLSNNINDGYIPFTRWGSSGVGYSFITIGSDDGTLYPIDYDNYKLGNAINDITATSYTIETPAYNEDTNEYIIPITYDFKATTDITIKELGVIHVCNVIGSVLVYREVLNNPITVAAKAYARVTFNVSAPANANKTIV